MTAPRPINAEGIALIKDLEGLRIEAYQDQAGVWTIGYGHTKGVRQGLTCTAEEAEAWLREDLRDAEEAVERLTEKALRPLTDNQFAALVSFVFNVGAQKFESSTARKRLLRGQYRDAADAMTWFDKITDPKTGAKVPSTGLRRRRQREKALFLMPDA